MSALGHEQTLASKSGMSALPPEADMFVVGINVCYVPEADGGLRTQCCSCAGWSYPLGKQ